MDLSTGAALVISIVSVAWSVVLTWQRRESNTAQLRETVDELVVEVERLGRLTRRAWMQRVRSGSPAALADTDDSPPELATPVPPAPSAPLNSKDELRRRVFSQLRRSHEQAK